MRLCKVGNDTFTWNGTVLTLVRKVHGKYVPTGKYVPEKDEFLGMDDETRANALVAYSMFSVIPPQISIETV
jgi:hypothetical protein